jgi:hypothetical protein
MDLEVRQTILEILIRSTTAYTGSDLIPVFKAIDALQKEGGAEDGTTSSTSSSTS